MSQKHCLFLDMGSCIGYHFFHFSLEIQFSNLNIGGMEPGSMQLSSQSPVILALNMPFLCCCVGFVWQGFCKGELQG